MWLVKTTFVYTASMLKRAAPAMLILRKAALGAVPLQIRSFAACADPFTKKKKKTHKRLQTQEMGEAHKSDDRQENQSVFRGKSSKHM